MGYIIKPLVTEKMTALTDKRNNVFGFIVRPEANKIQIKAEIESKYESIPDTFHHYETGFTDALEWVLSIIDKYKAESEEKEK